MKEVATLTPALVRDVADSSRSRLRWLWTLIISAFTAASCLVGGLAISLLTLLEVIGISSTRASFAVGLLVTSFGLMFLGAHSMDRIAAIDRVQQIESGRRHGLSI